MKDVVGQILVGSLSCLIALSQSAMASEKGTFSTSVGTQVTHDDNLYKINKDSEQVRLLLPDFNFSDTVNSVFANADMNWDVSKQNIVASVAVTKNKFANNTQLDNTATNVKAKWNWHLPAGLSGDIGYSKDRQLANFNDNLNAALLASKIDNDHPEFNINWRFHSRWQTQVGIAQRTTEYSIEALAINNKDVVTSQAKLIYESEADNTFSLSVSQANISYENRDFDLGDTIDSDYLLSTIVLSTNYNYSEKSLITAKLIWRDLDPDHLESAQQFSISDWGYNINYRWRPTATTQFTALLADEISPSENANTDFQRSKVLNLGMTWQLSSKIYLGVQAEYKKRRYEFNSSLINGLDVATKNTYKKSNINVMYVPSNFIELRVGYEFNNQRSDLLIRNYDSNTTYATIIAKF